MRFKDSAEAVRHCFCGARFEDVLQSGNTVTGLVLPLVVRIATQSLRGMTPRPWVWLPQQACEPQLLQQQHAT